MRSDLRPRGRCRLILRRRADGEIVYRSAWISMAAEGLSIARLLASLRSSPHAKEIEAAWRVRSLCLTPAADIYAKTGGRYEETVALLKKGATSWHTLHEELGGQSALPALSGS